MLHCCTLLIILHLIHLSVRSVILALLINILCSCAAAQNNYIVFNPDTTYRENVVRLYIDRAGNIYPPGNYIHTSMFPCICRRSLAYANLRAYFEKYDAAARQRVYERYGASDFDALQKALLTACADSINAKLHGRRLVVLIHGFNDYATRGYDIIKNNVEATAGKDRQLYLEVYWDGLKASSEKFKEVSKIWFRANRTAPYAAYTLRKLFLQVQDVEMYILAHSLGASVAARLLFNPHNRRSFPLRDEWLHTPAPSQSHITLALLAPAMPGRRVFKYIDHTVPSGQCNKYRKLLIGYNQHDYATTKKMRFPLSRMFYSTSLGCNPGAVKRTGAVVKEKCKNIGFTAIDLSTCPHADTIHHIHQYAACPGFDTFIQAVFN